MLHDVLSRYAASNTRKGVESCGILAGVLDEKNACFQICTLIIPKQEGTSDTVQARTVLLISHGKRFNASICPGWKECLLPDLHAYHTIAGRHL